MKHLGTVELNSERLKLRRLTKDDALATFEGLRNQEEFLYYANKEKVTLEEHLKSLENIDEKYKNLDYYNWIIERKSDNKVLGLITLRVFEVNESVEFSYGLDNRYTKQCYMSEALQLVLDFALNDMKVNRIQGGCCVENIASRRVMEKCNMHHEGILKSYLKLRDGYHDLHMFSLVNKK
jgi:ribosomal-protein-alanine N-acetyltransferase